MRPDRGEGGAILFTNRRLILVEKHGVTGKRIEYQRREAA
jgi:hypothetical protein